MTVTIATMSSKISWSNINSSTVNAIIDNGGIDYSLDFVSNTGVTGINEIFYDNLALVSGTSTLDLGSLSRDVLDSSMTISFTGGNIKALEFNSLSNINTEVALNYGQNKHGKRLLIPPSSSIGMSDAAGWSISSGDSLDIYTTGIGNILIGIIGVTG